MALDWNTLGQAAGLAMLLEGVVYFCFPERMAPVLRQLAESPPGVLRLFGGLAIAIGLLLVFLFKSS